MSPPERASAPQSDRDYNTQIVWPIARYVEDTFGAEALRKLATKVGVAVSDFDGRPHWISLARFEAFLAQAHELTGSDDAFKKACVHRIREAYGALRYLTWATSPAAVYRQAMSSLPMLSSVGELQYVDGARNWFRFRYVTNRTFSRLNCLLRQAQTATLPEWWGLPPAHVEENGCVAFGDPACEIRVRWFEHRRRLPELTGAVTLATGLTAAGQGLVSSPLAVGGAALAGALAFIYELRRTERVNRKIREEFTGALQKLAEEELAVRQDLLALHERQNDWNRLIEKSFAERDSALQRVTEQVASFQEARRISHDLRSPLLVVLSSLEYLFESGAGTDEAKEAADDARRSIDQMKRMLASLMEIAAEGRHQQIRTAPSRIEIPLLADRVRRSLKALVHGRQVRGTVFTTREAPEWVEIDQMVLDRIVDNVLTNAAKYTQRGSIIVEVDGTPGFLVLKISDTGRGIEPERLERVFTPGGSKPEERAVDSYGVGLSVVVRLLRQVGGRLEVMSKPDVGTTLWLHIPSRAVVSEESEVLEIPLSQVVKIRGSAKLGGA